MSKQSEAKKRQNYNPKPDRDMCSNCIHYVSEIIEREGFMGATIKDERDKFCTFGGFAVKKTATCSEHKFIS